MAPPLPPPGVPARSGSPPYSTAVLPARTQLSTVQDTPMLLRAPPLAQVPPWNVLFTTYTGSPRYWSSTRIAAPPRSGPVRSHSLRRKREFTTLNRPPRTNTAPPPPPSVVPPVALPSANVRFCTVSRGVSWLSQCDVVQPCAASHVFWYRIRCRPPPDSVTRPPPASTATSTTGTARRIRIGPTLAVAARYGCPIGQACAAFRCPGPTAGCGRCAVRRSALGVSDRRRRGVALRGCCGWTAVYARGRALRVERHHERQHPGHRGVQSGRDLVAQVAGLVQGARQRDVLHHRDPLAGRRLADLRGDRPSALRDHPRRSPRRVVPQRDRHVRRVEQDDVGLRQVGHHPPARHFHLPPADRGLDERVALLALVLLLDLLLAHPDLLAHPTAGHGVVRCGRHESGQRGGTHDAEQRAGDDVECRGHRDGGARHQPGHEPLQREVHGTGQYQRLDDRLDRLPQRVRAHRTLEALPWVEALEVRLQ